MTSVLRQATADLECVLSQSIEETIKPMILRLLSFGTVGLLSYMFWGKRRQQGNAAYADDQPQSSHRDVRDAGPQAMRDKPQEEWTKTDQESDESFPASDPPGNY